MKKQIIAILLTLSPFSSYGQIIGGGLYETAKLELVDLANGFKIGFFLRLPQAPFGYRLSPDITDEIIIVTDTNAKAVNSLIVRSMDGEVKSFEYNGTITQNGKNLSSFKVPKPNFFGIFYIPWYFVIEIKSNNDGNPYPFIFTYGEKFRYEYYDKGLRSEKKTKWCSNGLDCFIAEIEREK